MSTLQTLIQDLQRQMSRVRGQISLELDLITAALKDLAALRERVDTLEKKEKEQ